jgi:hypothetical protein
LGGKKSGVGFFEKCVCEKTVKMNFGERWSRIWEIFEG